LREIELLELGVHLDKGRTYPFLEGFGSGGHSPKYTRGAGFARFAPRSPEDGRGLRDRAGAMLFQSIAIETGPVPAVTDNGDAGVRAPPLTV
jgi:hypothetical protein